MQILSQLRDHADNYDLDAMNAVVANLSPAQLEENRQAIISTYIMVYASARYDLDCGKANDTINFIVFLLNIIHSIQRFFPELPYYQERGLCYEDLAYNAPNEDKPQYIQEAIRIYNTAPPTTSIQLSMVRALIDKMEITRQFTTEAFTELLSFFRPALNDASLIKPLVHLCFRVRFLPFKENHHWYQQLLQELEEAMHEHAKKDPLVYLNWAEAYHSIQDSYAIDPEFKHMLVAQTALLLKSLEGYYTEEADVLLRLGDVFANTAKRSANDETSLALYNTAVHCFTKHHERHQTIWNFPVNVINTLGDMAHRYQKSGDREKLIGTFEHGLQLFSQTDKHEEDATLNLYWGDFLIEYSGLVYNYQSPAINQLAEEKLQLAKTLLWQYQAHPHFSRPYLSMARLAIKSGDKEKCVALLLQCKEAIRLKGYTAYDLSEALADEDFREVWSQL